MNKPVFFLVNSIPEIANFTQELQDFASKMVNSLRNAGDEVGCFPRVSQLSITYSIMPYK